LRYLNNKNLKLKSKHNYKAVENIKDYLLWILNFAGIFTAIYLYFHISLMFPNGFEDSTWRLLAIVFLTMEFSKDSINRELKKEESKNSQLLYLVPLILLYLSYYFNFIDTIESFPPIFYLFLAITSIGLFFKVSVFSRIYIFIILVESVYLIFNSDTTLFTLTQLFLRICILLILIRELIVDIKRKRKFIEI